MPEQHFQTVLGAQTFHACPQVAGQHTRSSSCTLAPHAFGRTIRFNSLEIFSPFFIFQASITNTHSLYSSMHQKYHLDLLKSHFMRHTHISLTHAASLNLFKQFNHQMYLKISFHASTRFIPILLVKCMRQKLNCTKKTLEIQEFFFATHSSCACIA